MNYNEISCVRPRVWVEINQQKLRTNFKKICSRVAPLNVLAVLKANAYGLGMEEVASNLVEAGAHAIGVAELREALSVKKFGVPVHILGGLIPEEVEQVIQEDIVAPVTDLSMAKLLSEEALRQNKQVKCHILLDTGMGRLGLTGDYKDVILRILKLPGLQCDGIYSHFPYAYGDCEFSRKQLCTVGCLLSELKKEGITFKYVHISNSDGINNIPAASKHPFNMVRTGINLYGVYDLSGNRGLELQPVLTLKSRLVAVRELQSGTTIGYGLSCKLPRKTKVGTVSVGYADGMPLALSNCGYVLVNGNQCPILGRVSMDYITISLENVAEAQPGDEVVCIGAGGEYEITVEQWAQQKGSHPYDIICSIGNRVVRKYI